MGRPRCFWNTWNPAQTHWAWSLSLWFHQFIYYINVFIDLKKVTLSYLRVITIVSFVDYWVYQQTDVINKWKESNQLVFFSKKLHPSQHLYECFHNFAADDLFDRMTGYSSLIYWCVYAGRTCTMKFTMWVVYVLCAEQKWFDVSEWKQSKFDI